MNQTKTLVVAPAHNEENGIKRFIESVFSEAPDSSLLIVDDSSTDGTWKEICSLKERFKNLNAIRLRKNVGQQRAILAGFQYAFDELPKFEYYVSMDSDGQDPEECIPMMIEACVLASVDLVVGYRNDRTVDSIWKRIPASWFYTIMQKVFNVTLVPHAAEFRVLTQSALSELLAYNEVKPFWRGLTEYSGVNKINFQYTRKARSADASSYSTKEMLKLAETGIVSFSQVPLRLIFVLGISITFFSFLGITIYLASYLFFGAAVQGWLSLILVSLFFGGMQMFSLGIIGIYLLEILENVRNRPRYTIISKI